MAVISPVDHPPLLVIGVDIEHERLARHVEALAGLDLGQDGWLAVHRPWQGGSGIRALCSLPVEDVPVGAVRDDCRSASIRIDEQVEVVVEEVHVVGSLVRGDRFERERLAPNDLALLHRARVVGKELSGQVAAPPFVLAGDADPSMSCPLAISELDQPSPQPILDEVCGLVYVGRGHMRPNRCSIDIEADLDPGRPLQRRVVLDGDDGVRLKHWRACAGHDVLHLAGDVLTRPRGNLTADGQLDRHRSVRCGHDGPLSASAAQSAGSECETPGPEVLDERGSRPGKSAGNTGTMRTESLDTSSLALPDGTGPFPGVVVIHEASGLNDNIREICRRFAGEGYAALGVDLFQGRNRAVCLARMFVGGMAGNLDYYGVPALKAALGRLG